MRVLVYRDLDIPKRLRASFDRVVKALERDDTRSADLKKLAGHDLYRVKLDYDSRLLLRLARHDGARLALALEVVESHAYDRSRFLRGATIREEDATDPPATATDDAAAGVSPLRYVHPTHQRFELLDKPLSFDDHQETLHALPLPLILVGCAGSGKTALTLSKLRTLTGSVLYVTQSEYLAEAAAGLYRAHAYENEQQSVEFLSFRRLIESIGVPKGRAVTARDFHGFFERHRQNFKFTSAHALFEELRGVIGAAATAPLSLDEYLGLGVRQSLFPAERRAAVHQLFDKYREWLASSGLYDQGLLAHEYRPRAEKRFDAVVVDELQDLTNAELALVLATLADPRRFMLCGDANQIVHPNFFSWSKVKSLFWSDETEALEATINVLDANYRSARSVCELANRLLLLKNARFGSVDRESTALVRPVAEADGRAVGIVDSDAVVRELDKVARTSARVAVVVLDEDRKAEARRKFRTPLVFSVMEAKGLEYDAVILYGIVASARGAFQDVADGVTRDAIRAGELEYARAKDKGDKSLEAYKFFVNSLYVAITRAIETVYVVEPDPSHPLLRLLDLPFARDVAGFTMTASTTAEWQREARRLELQGKAEQADAIRRTVLHETPVPWTVLHGAAFDAHVEKALAPRSIFNKAKQQLAEFGAFHDLRCFERRLAEQGFKAPKAHDAMRGPARERLLAPYQQRDFRRVIDDVDKYGVDHRTMMSLTPLMLAAWAGHVQLVEELLERGANPRAVDVFGRQALHFALRSAVGDANFARDRLGALYALLAPPFIEIETDGRRLNIGRDQGEFYVLAMLTARFHENFGVAGLRLSAFTVDDVWSDALAAFPRSVIPDARRRREYWNGVLARAEEDAKYSPPRRLWKREARGKYLPSRVTLLRVAADDGSERYASLDELMRLDLLDPRRAPIAGGGSVVGARWS